jgi:hypothetical protein
LNNITAGVRERQEANGTREAGHLDEIHGVLANTLKSFRNGAVGCIGFHEKAFKLKMKFISFGWAALFDRASMRTRCGGPGLDPI